MIPIKNIFYLTILIVCLLLISCKKTIEDPIIRPHSGEGTALKDGKNWLGEPYAIFLKPEEEVLGVSIEVFNELGFLRQLLSFYKIPPQVGLYPLNNTIISDNDDLIGAGYYTLSSDGDVLGGIWNILETADNQLEITDVNVETGDIEGIFQVTMVLDSMIRSQYIDELQVPLPYEDTIRFTDGQFFTKIVN